MDPPPPPPHPPFAPGDRIRVGGDGATVRYAGPLAGKPGAWVGLEWDDEARGRHGGEAGGKSYFSVRAAAPTAGSFVREDALRPVAVRSTTLHDALTYRYARGGDGRGAVVGGAAVAERQADLGALEAASVAGMPVHGPVRIQDEGGGADRCRRRLKTPATPLPLPSPIQAPPGTLPPLASLTELDASGTLLPGWPAAAALASSLPALAALDLSRASLHLIPPSACPTPFPLTALRSLVLADTRLTWSDAVAAAGAAPALTSLSLRACGVSTLCPPPDDSFPLLADLDLSDNDLDGWATVDAALGRLPALARLDVSGSTRLTGLAPRDAPFPFLTSLCMDDTGLASWGAVAALASFPALASFRAARAPLPTPSPSAGSARADLVARLPVCVARLNGAPISGWERREAERALVAAAAPAPAPRPLAATMLALTLIAPDGRSAPARLPASTPVARVRAVGARLAGGPASAWAAAPLELRRAGGGVERLAPADDGRELAFLGAADGDAVACVE